MVPETGTLFLFNFAFDRFRVRDRPYLKGGTALPHAGIVYRRTAAACKLFSPPTPFGL